jgi:hypothetical protein
MEKIREYKARPIAPDTYNGSDLLLEEMAVKINEIIDVINSLTPNKE